MNPETTQQYVQILKEELILALGCTEPIAIAYAAATAREVLGAFPEEITVQCSGNIIKNVKGVVVPMTKNMRGIKTAAILGALGGDAGRKLEVLTTVTPADVEQTRELLQTDFCKEALLPGSHCLHIIVSMKAAADTSRVEIRHGHTDIVRIEKNGAIIEETLCKGETTETKTDRDIINIAGIVDFANTVDLSLVDELLTRQITYNTAISDEGLRGAYGTNIGRTLLENFGDDIKVRARARAAAGSDARMSGCELPVVINSGSGNQGMTVSLPLIEYAKELGKTKVELYRALCVSNLVSIHQKTKIGKLSAYCGAVSAAAGAGAGIAYLLGGRVEEISLTIINTLANVGGIVCDGAKPSCAAKIASSLDAAIMGVILAMDGKAFGSGEGLVKCTIEETIANFGSMAKLGMRETDQVILHLMTAD